VCLSLHTVPAKGFLCIHARGLKKEERGKRTNERGNRKKETGNRKEEKRVLTSLGQFVILDQWSYALKRMPL